MQGHFVFCSKFLLQGVMQNFSQIGFLREPVRRHIPTRNRARNRARNRNRTPKIDF